MRQNRVLFGTLIILSFSISIVYFWLQGYADFQFNSQFFFTLLLIFTLLSALVYAVYLGKLKSKDIILPIVLILTSFNFVFGLDNSTFANGFDYLPFIYLIISILLFFLMVLLVKQVNFLSKNYWNCLIIALIFLLLPEVQGIKLSTLFYLFYILTIVGFVNKRREVVHTKFRIFWSISFPSPALIGQFCLFALGDLLVGLYLDQLALSILVIFILSLVFSFALGKYFWLLLGTFFIALGSLIYIYFWGNFELFLANLGLNIHSVPNYLLSNGGLIGKGFNLGYEDFPDTVSQIGLTLGFSGIVAVILLEFILIERFVRIGLEAKSDYTKTLTVAILCYYLTIILFAVLNTLEISIFSDFSFPFLNQIPILNLFDWIFLAILLLITADSHTLVNLKDTIVIDVGTATSELKQES